jgi:peroxiredoxin
MKLNKGNKIPELKLRDHNEEEVSLDKFDGKNVLLSFHPLAWTSVCRNQMQALEDNYEEFEKNNTVPLGISVDPVPSKSAWAEDIGLNNLRLVSDFWPHGEFADKLGIFIKEKGISGRVNILVNAEGEILWAKEYDIPELPDIDEVLEAAADNA